MNKISDKDKKDWENFLSSDENLKDKDINLIKINTNKTQSFDLHGYSLNEANKKIESLIYDAYIKEIHKLIIVTGKGLHSENEKNPYISKKLGILRYSVPAYIKNNKELMKMIKEIQIADAEDGGSGAFYILLKKNL